MQPKSPSPASTASRCQYRTAAGRPGFDAYGDCVSETNATDQNQPDATDEATQTEDPAKSQKPN